MAGGRLWTIPEDERLREMLAKDVQPKHIAAALGRSEKSITQRMHTLGLKVPLELVKKRRADGCRKKVATPIARQQHCVTQRANWTPERRKAASERMKANNDVARLHAPEVKARSIEAIRRRKIERQWAIIDQAWKEFVAAAERERLAKMTPFERQLERARKFGITERPRLAANDYDFSLTGSCLA